MITLDASVIIAHIEDHDAHHAAATDYLTRSPDAPLLIHSVNLAEVLVGPVKHGRGEEALADVEAMGVVVADRPGDEALLLAKLRVESGLRLPDCCALGVAIRTGSRLATFDRALAAAAHRHGVAVEPGLAVA